MTTRPARRRAGVAAALMMCLALATPACSGVEETGARAAPAVTAGRFAEPGPEPVEVSEIGLASLEMPVTASGSTRARRVSGLGAELRGRILAVYVDVGDPVETGNALFALDPAPYKAALDEARAGLALARAEHQSARHEERRVERLAQRHAASEAQRDQLATAEDAATARVAQMEARVVRAESDLERTLIRAPYPGTVVERRAHEGDMAGPEPVVVLQERGPLVAVLNIPESTPVPVRAGAPVLIHAPGLAAPIATRVNRVSARVDADTRTYEVRAIVEDESGTIKAGSYVYAEIMATPAGPRPVVERSALLMRDGRTYLFALDPGEERVRQVSVRAGAITDEWVEILSGADPGERVVRGEVVRRLADGDAVRPAAAGLAGGVAARGAAR